MADAPWLSSRTGRGLWRDRVEATPDAPFLVTETVTATFAETDDRVRRLAGGLASLGVAAGRRVAVAMPNAPETFWVHAALRELGAVIVPLVPGLTFPELAFQIAHSRAEVLIATGATGRELPARRSELAGVRVVVTAAADGAAADAPLQELLAADPHPVVRDRDGDEDAPWAIFYTSGSTGRPKGVVLPAGAFVTGGWGYAERFGLRADDGYVVATPMAHAVAGLTEPSGAIHAGARLVVLERFRPSLFWTQVADTNGTVSILFPAQLKLLLALQDDGPSFGESPLRLAITHAPAPEFQARFGTEIGVCWGMTETGAGSTGAIPDADQRAEGYVGRPMAGVEVAVFDAQGAPLQPGEPGEICLRTRYQMIGYLDDPEATERTLAGGWVHSGDIGRLDADGGLHFGGRIKNMIKRAGENISPEEVERAIDQVEAVHESLVLGVPDPLRTEEAAAIVVAPDGGLTPEGLIAELATRLAAWKLPRYVEVRRDPLPRLANGKIDSRAARAQLSLQQCWDREATRPGLAGRR